MMKPTTLVGVALLVGAGYVAAAQDPDQTTDTQSTDAQPSIIDEGNSSSTMSSGHSMSSGSMSSDHSMSGGSMSNDDSMSNSSASTTQAQKDFQALDSNHDGYLSRAESQQAGPLDFNAVDRNSDGRIDQDEYSTAYQRGLTAQNSMNSEEPHSQVGSANSQSKNNTSRMP